MTDFSLVGPRFAGGPEIEEPWAPELIFVPPNLTPDQATGHIVNWSEDQFVARFESGASIEGSPMDWRMFARMSETDVRAIYRYLMSLGPVRNETGPTVRPRTDRSGSSAGLVDEPSKVAVRTSTASGVLGVSIGKRRGDAREPSLVSRRIPCSRSGIF